MLLEISKKITKIIFIFALLIGSAQAQATTKDATNFVNDLAARVISIVADKNSSAKEKESTLNKIFVQSVDTKWIGRFSMGRYWRTITPAQQEQFLDVYTSYLTQLYVPNFRKYTGNIVTVLASKELRPNEYLVQTSLTDNSNSMNIKIDYHLMQKDGGIENFVIFDIVAEGVSLITTQRSEIGSILAKEDFNALLASLTEKANSSN